MKVSLFIPCFVDQLVPRVGLAVATVLERLGHACEFRPAQTCCGQPSFNSGFWDEARQVARHALDVFAGAEAVVGPSGSCVAMLRVFYPQLLAGTPQEQAANDLAARTYEFGEFLVRRLGVEDVGARFPHRVTYHDGCHGLRELRVKDEPRRLLRAVRDLERVRRPAVAGPGLTGCRLEMPPIRLLAAEPCDRLMANRPVPRIVYGCLHLPSICRSAHGRRGHRVSRAKPTPPARRPRGVSSLRAASAREDAAPQDRVGEPRELARVARSRRAARAGIRRGRTPRLSRVRAPLLRLRPRGLHDVPHGIRRGILLQGPRRLPVLQRPPHGPDGRAFCRSRHPAGARAAVGDLRAQAIAGHACRPTPSRRRTQRSYRRGQSPRPIWPRLQSGCAAA